MKLATPAAMQRLPVLLCCACALAAMAVSTLRQGDMLLYNPSSSMPRGFYLRGHSTPTLGAIVTVRARDVAAAYASQRNFTDEGDRFIKRVAAMRGDHVCTNGNTVSVNGGQALMRQAHDSNGLALPQWNECRVLRANEFFLVGDTDDSFDSRYWGPVTTRAIEGVWTPLR